MDYLTLDEILEATMPEDDVELPECKGSVRVRAITGFEWALAKRQATSRKTDVLNEIKFAALLTIAGCIEPEFAPKSEDLLLRKMSAGVITRIAGRIGELSGFEEDEDDDQGEA